MRITFMADKQYRWQRAIIWLTTKLKCQVYSLAYEKAATWRQLTFIHVTRVNSRNGFDVDDSSINNFLVIIIIIT